MKQLIEKTLKRKSVIQLIKYAMVGVVGLIIDMGVYYLLVQKFSVHYPSSVYINQLLGGNMSIRMVDIVTSNTICSSLGIINNFILNSYFTFKVTNHKWRRFVSFLSIGLVGMAISSFLITLFIGVFKMDEMIAKALSIIVVALIQFVVNKLVTFRQKEAQAKS